MVPSPMTGDHKNSPLTRKPQPRLPSILRRLVEPWHGNLRFHFMPPGVTARPLEGQSGRRPGRRTTPGDCCAARTPNDARNERKKLTPTPCRDAE
jgi:hypothetical protein